tara:strand:- start:210 stop:386 length:177 start_codon:yes stop_codon:yes gene_type:complete
MPTPRPAFAGGQPHLLLSFSHAAAAAAADGSGASGRRTLQPAVFLEAVDLADEMAGGF